MSSTTRENRIITLVGCPKCGAPVRRACSLTHDGRPIVHLERRVAWQEAKVTTAAMATATIPKQRPRPRTLHWVYSCAACGVVGSVPLLKHTYIQEALGKITVAHSQLNPGCNAKTHGTQIQLVSVGE